MIRIPGNLSDVEKKLAKNPKHTGLIRAYKSATNNRSPNCATILLLGLTGAGKSSTVNSLFGMPIAVVNDYESCSMDIIEYEIEIPFIEEIQSSDLILRIIDTPGFGDTRYKDMDARMMGTIRNYFENGPYKGIYPNIILICGKFDDNRFAGEMSSFVKMLKGVNSMNTFLVDENYNNSIVCMTHLTNVTKELRRNPKPRCASIAQVVKQFTCLTNPVVVVAENAYEDKELPMENGYAKLPNGEYYPYNLLLAMQNITLLDDTDPMGETIIRNAFKNIKDFTVKIGKIIPLLPVQDSAVRNAIKEMDQIRYPIKDTLVNQKIVQTWNNNLIISKEERDNYPEVLLCIQRIFESRKIETFQDIPTTKEKLLELAQRIEPSPIVPKLLLGALGMRIPKLEITLVVGQCYNLICFDKIPKSIFDFADTWNFSPIGYLIPNHLQCDLHTETKDVCSFYTETEEYLNARLKSLNVHAKIELSAFGNHLKASAGDGYNILCTNQDLLNTTKFTAVRDTRLFRLTLKDTDELSFTKEFTETVNSLPEFTQNDFDSVEKFKNFFAKYGTHIVQSAFGGGSIKMSATALNTVVVSSAADIQDLSRSLQVGFQQKFQLALDKTDTDTNESFHLKKKIKWEYTTQLTGGDQKYHTEDMISVKHSKAENIKNLWSKSLMTYPIMLENGMQLVPISLYAGKISQFAENQIAVAAKKLFEASLEYVKPKTPPPPERSNIPDPKKSGSSCLKAGTEILMANGLSKKVEDVVAGDFVLDMDLNSCAVIGVNYVHLWNKNFFGFSPTNCYFSSDHLIVGSAGQLYVASNSLLKQYNPLLSKVQPIQIETGSNICVLKWDKESLSVLSEEQTVYMDHVSYPVDTKIYYLIVDSPTGTYFANGFVCRHELPPFHMWTLPMIKVFQDILMNNHLIKYVRHVEELTILEMVKIECLISMIDREIEKTFNEENFDNTLLDYNNVPMDMWKDIEDIQKYANKFIGAILANSVWAAFAMLLYAKIVKYFDSVGSLGAQFGKGDIMKSIACKIIENELI